MRILGLGLLVALVVSAIGAGSALASKDPFNVNTWTQYKFCPYENREETGVTDCIYGRTNGGKEGGFFQYGKVKVPLAKPVVIQGGFRGSGPEIEVLRAVGAETLESPELAITKGLNTITPKIQEEAEWPQALMESFAAAKAAKETKAFVKIEMAGNECFTVPGCLNTENLILEQGTAFRLPLKVKITSPWLEKLGGGPCLVGSDEHPILQHLTSGGAGRAGDLEFGPEFFQIEVKNSQLVDVNWHIQQVSGASGCGGTEYESYVDKALNLALEVENFQGTEFSGKRGITVLTGNLHDGNAGVTQEHHEKGEF